MGSTIYIKSALLLERAKKVLAGGVSSEFRKYNHPRAIFYTHGKGSRIYDVDGNEYLDFTLSQGPFNPRPLSSTCFKVCKRLFPEWAALCRTTYKGDRIGGETELFDSFRKAHAVLP